jgi:hypothetical protein
VSMWRRLPPYSAAGKKVCDALGRVVATAADKNEACGIVAALNEYCVRRMIVATIRSKTLRSSARR